jgi:hypothetical protein
MCPRWDRGVQSMPIVCPIRRQRRSNYGDLYCWMHSIWPATSSLSRSLFTNAWLGLTPPAWTPRCRSSPGTQRERVSRPAPSRRTDTRQDRPHCLITQHSRGPTCPRRTALAVSLSTTDLDQLRWTAEAPTPVDAYGKGGTPLGSVALRSAVFLVRRSRSADTDSIQVAA